MARLYNVGEDSEMATDVMHGCGCGYSGRRRLGLVVLLVSGALILAGLVALWRSRAGEPRSGAAGSSASGHSCVTFDHTHSAWTAILNRYVHDGRVDYAALKSSDQSEFAAYLHSLQSVCRTHYEKWPHEQKLAFWINAYNAFTVRLILDHYPVESIQKIGLLPGAAFRTELIEMPAARPGRMSLNDLEHGILRTEFHEPRIHFAIVCASKACPQLSSAAYRAGDLDAQLDAAARGFILDTAKNRFDPSTHTLYLSSIFKWFREDFDASAGTLPAFVARYAEPSMAAAARAGDVDVEFLDYDWSLNGR